MCPRVQVVHRAIWLPVQHTVKNMLPGLYDKRRWIATLQAAIIALVLGHGCVVKSIPAIICSGGQTKWGRARGPLASKCLGPDANDSINSCFWFFGNRPQWTRAETMLHRRVGRGVTAFRFLGVCSANPLLLPPHPLGPQGLYQTAREVSNSEEHGKGDAPGSRRYST